MHCSTAVGATTAVLPAPPHHHHPAQNSNNYFQLCCRTMINDWQFEPFVRFLVFTQTMTNYAGALAFKHPACTANLLISCDTLFCCTLFALHNANTTTKGDGPVASNSALSYWAQVKTLQKMAYQTKDEIEPLDYLPPI